MTVDELIGQLQELSDGGYGDYDALVVHQPGWPLQEKIVNVWMDDEALDSEEDSEEDSEKEDSKFVYIVADGHPYGVSPYGPKAAFCF
jgi:hypothetical protein